MLSNKGPCIFSMKPHSHDALLFRRASQPAPVPLRSRNRTFCLLTLLTMIPLSLTESSGRSSGWNPQPSVFRPPSCFPLFPPIRSLRHPIRGVRYTIMPRYRPILMALAWACWAFAATPDGKTQKSGDEQVLFVDLPTVEAVALHAQTLAEAPANVSVTTAATSREPSGPLDCVLMRIPLGTAPPVARREGYGASSAAAFGG